jgi:hypothetical protein
MTTVYIRIEPQPDPCADCADMDTPGIWSPHKSPYKRWGICRAGIIFDATNPPGSLLDGKRVVSNGVVKIADLTNAEALAAGYEWLPNADGGGYREPTQMLCENWPGDFANDWAWKIETEGGE